ncbi:aminoacyl-tRNA hydrolase [Patescibacteria group bacterium]|nr:aminoacyl-tRNA hydrolase [Patescibacteria group bacterium]MBU0777436.1 aminoacyl-tRNA hydrolase [Patescibacteria group bacterium]MBU0846071.1 aminoacyl-tRNA hydrolase [Patescibacteria group bacterium]MBU0923124.1 aminoacyl-tRNA hydrolase [Patescibacteria group bacterium]MBU1066839.1 aminoacyl-tRNA hydrolase [Patescibacteria group bacterium]
MKLIVGLGNPGDKHRNNRHNSGYLVVDEMANQLFEEEWSSVKKFQSLIIKHEGLFMLAKPQTFMNQSGEAVKKLIDQYKIKSSDLWVIHDDLDIALGDYKIQKGKGPKLHKGIKSIEDKIGKTDFWRVRIGVDNRSAENKISGEAYVLQDFTEEEVKIITPVIVKINREVISLMVKNK